MLSAAMFFVKTFFASFLISDIVAKTAGVVAGKSPHLENSPMENFDLINTLQYLY